MTCRAESSCYPHLVLLKSMRYGAGGIGQNWLTTAAERLCLKTLQGCWLQSHANHSVSSIAFLCVIFVVWVLCFLRVQCDWWWPGSLSFPSCVSRALGLAGRKEHSCSLQTPAEWRVLYSWFLQHLVTCWAAEMSRMSSVRATEEEFLMPFPISVSQHNQVEGLTVSALFSLSVRWG